METFSAGQFDIAVIGAGHAGIEAALAAARLGLETIVFTINLDAVGNMPCNPAIGGTGKGHLVRELDALGGEMAKAADECCIQYRLLNLRKGPTVWSLRAQADRRKYQERMKRTLERQEHLTVRQGQVVDVRTEHGAVSEVVLSTGAVYGVKAVILATGTYLKGRTIIGTCVEDSGPDGMHAAGPLTDSLRKLGLPLRRFKTGTPPRVNARTVDFDEMEVQPGDRIPVPFSYSTKNPPYNQAVCWLTWTTEETKRIVQENLDRAPMYSGLIEGIGPRYCPSFETKIVRFVQAGDQAHQRGLAAAGAAQNAHGSAAGNVQVHILQNPLRALVIVFEGHMVKVDAAVLHAISWVTIIMVVFCSARPRMTFRTSPVSSGSSAEVGSSKQRMSGCSASARAMATRCC